MFMNSDSEKDTSGESSNKRFFRHLARAFGGAILFSFPVLMTMEMWFLGFYMSGWRLALFILLTVPLLIGLSYYDGFEDTSCLTDDVVDTFVAYAVGFVCSAALLFLFGVVNWQMSWGEIIGKISIQAIIGSFGAMFAQSLLIGGGGDEKDDESEDRKRDASYFGELFLMAIGAIFLSMSVAPTEEVILISFQMSDWQTIALVFVTLLLMQAFFYSVEFRGHEKPNRSGKTFAGVFFRFTSVGYAIALLISFYILWTFGSIDDMAFAVKLKAVIVLAFPAAVGASASRLIL